MATQFTMLANSGVTTFASLAPGSYTETAHYNPTDNTDDAVNYAGNPVGLLVNKSVTISAEEGSGTVEVYVGEGSVLVVNGPGAALRGLTLTSADQKLAAVDVHRGELALDDCKIVGAAWTAVLVVV